MYEVWLRKWVSGEGFAWADTIDNLDEFCTAQEYADGLEPIELEDNENILIEVRDSDSQEVLSEAWYR